MQSLRKQNERGGNPSHEMEKINIKVFKIRKTGEGGTGVRKRKEKPLLIRFERARKELKEAKLNSREVSY